MQGFLNINKPQGWTSRDVVNAVVRCLPRGTKAGHAGTLDPLATGVLVVAVGRATRLISMAQEGRKRYRAEFLFGRTSDTEDIEGEVVELENPPQPTADAIASVLPELTGDIMQRPPAYSAIQVGGKRAYDLARKGEEVELAPRPVRVESIEVLSYDYPTLTLDVECGKGTYIRSLGRDLAEKLGTGAVMSALVRTQVGAFRLENAVSMDDVRQDGLERHIRPLIEAIPESMARVTPPQDALRRLLQGQIVTLDAAAEEVAVLWEEEVAAIAQRVGPGRYRGGVNLLSVEELVV